MKRYLSLILTSLLFLITSTSALASYHWAPMGTEPKIPRGEKSVMFSADIINETAEEQYYVLEFADAIQDRDGSYRSVPLGTAERSCGGWIELLGARTLFLPDVGVIEEPVLEPLYDMKFSLRGEEWKQILFEITAPRKATGGYSAAVRCTPILKPEEVKEEAPKELREELEGELTFTKTLPLRSTTVVLLTVEKRRRPKPFKKKGYRI